MRASCSRPPASEVAVKLPTIMATMSSGRTSSRSVLVAASASRIGGTAAASSSRAWDTVTVPAAKTARSVSAISRLAAT